MINRHLKFCHRVPYAITPPRLVPLLWWRLFLYTSTNKWWTLDGYNPRISDPSSRGDSWGVVLCVYGLSPSAPGAPCHSVVPHIALPPSDPYIVCPLPLMLPRSVGPMLAPFPVNLTSVIYAFLYLTELHATCPTPVPYRKYRPP